MDKDIRAALFDGFDEEGDFEELQDDFMLQVNGERTLYCIISTNSYQIVII